MTPTDATAQLVAMYERAGLASRRRRIPAEQPPSLIEAEYAAALVGYVREWRAIVDELVRDLPQLLAAVRTDDTTEGTRVRSTINRARTVANRTASVARRAGQQAADHQKRQLGRQLKAGLGVDVPIADRKVPTMIERFVERNVSEIEGLEDKTLADMERLILDAFDRGVPADDLAAEIGKRFDIAERRARNIAGNQLSKLCAQVRRARHVEIGVGLFKWRNSPSHIARGVVRPAHKVKHDRIFPYEGSRAPSFFPGEEINCGCLAFPVLDEIKSKAAALAGKGRRRVV